MAEEDTTINHRESAVSESRLFEVADIFRSADHVGLAGTAHALVEAGVPVFPCVPGGKRPLTSHGFLDATTDRTQADAWWGKWPQANLAIPTGQASGFDVVDVDVRADGDGHDAFQAAGRQVDDLGLWAFAVATPSGGHHLYYPASEPSNRSWACSSAHVDFRGDGGYIIVPPSKVTASDGRSPSYWLVGTRPVAHPVDGQRLRDVVGPHRAELLRAVGARRDRRVSADVYRLADWVASRTPGERNYGLFWAACRVAESGQSLQAALDALSPAAQQVGLTDREIRSTISSAYRHAQPAAAPISPATATTYPLSNREAVTL